MAPASGMLGRLTVALLLCLAPALGGARGEPDDEAQLGLLPAGGGAGRGLLQSPADCARGIPNCGACRFQRMGTTTLTVCTACTTGYVVKNGGRSCWCAPGYKKVGSACVTCATGLDPGVYAYCAGSKATFDSGTATVCGANKLTSSAVAKSEGECVAAPGYGWMAGDGVAAQICDFGSYNPGKNNRKCTRCPGGLTTTAQGSTSVSSCMAPAGYYYYRGKAVACAKGYYKTAPGNFDCTGCLTGFTTTAVGSIAAENCTVLKAGYSAPVGTVGSATGAECGADTYRSGEAAYSGPPIDSPPSPAGMKTAGAVRSSSEAMCMAPPGYGYSAAFNNATACEVGTYSESWGREACVACGTGFLTDGVGATSTDGCKMPPGYGTSRAIATGVLSAAPCPVGTYGRDVATYGLLDYECTKCLQFTTTASTGSTTSAQCLTVQGYGYYDGGAQLCDYAYWSAGSSQDPCTYCGEGYNTSSSGAPTAPTTGAGALSDCAIAAGWTTDNAGGVKPCTQGYYKSLLGSTGCVKCPNGTTSTITWAAVAESDCDACRPGFGNAAIDLSAPACTLCAPGTYSFGYAQGGAPCADCTQPPGYTGAMTSRPGNDNPDQCYPEFPTDGATNSLQYDFIPMDASVLTVTAGVSQVACQAACQAAAGCQYYKHQDFGGGTTACSIRDKGVAAVDVTTSGTYILFEISEGQYVAYAGDSTDWASAGNNLATYSAGNFAANFQSAKLACDQTAACIGLKSSGSDWRTFGGSLAEGVVAKVRVAGAAINPWVAPPTAN